MRLEEHQQAIELAAARGFQRGANFGRVMAVVVDHHDVVDHALDIKAAADARKLGETFLDQVGRDVQIERHACSGGGVANVVNARRMRQLKNAEVFAFVGKTEFAAQIRPFRCR